MTTAHEVMECIGREAFEKLCRAFGGQRIYVPHRVPDYREHVLEVFNRTVGDSPSVMSAYEEAAGASGVSVRTVQRMVSTG